MSYLLLLALVCVIGFTTILISRATVQRLPDHIFIIVGFVFLGLGFLAQIALGFALDEVFAKLFFWARISMALSWLGFGVLFMVQPRMLFVRWLVIGVIGATILMFGLVVFTQMTEAQDWYSTARPIYAQINDLLATNRPTRWGALVLNILGVGAIFYALFLSHKKLKTLFSFVLVFLAAIGIFFSIYIPFQNSSVLFYFVELMTPILLFIGFDLFQTAHTEHRRKSK